MKNITCIIIFLSSLHFYSQDNVSSIACENGTMRVIKIDDYFKTDKISRQKDHDRFYIDVVIGNTSKNFISSTEHYFRNQVHEMDTTTIGYVQYWEDFTPTQKIEAVKIKKRDTKIVADEIHQETNQGQQIISLVNNSRKDLYFPSICGIPVIVLQAKNTTNEWKTIRFIQTSACGSCYSYSEIPKRSKLDVIVELPIKGSFTTKLRFKMLFEDAFIYSKEFDYAIDHCDFTEEGRIDNYCMNCDANNYNTLEVKPQGW